MVPGIHWLSKNPIIGTMAIVMGILSIIAVRIAAPQRRTIAVATIFVSTQDSINVAIYERTQAASSPPTRINREVKNKNTDSSSFLRYF